MCQLIEFQVLINMIWVCYYKVQCQSDFRYLMHKIHGITVQTLKKQAFICHFPCFVSVEIPRSNDNGSSQTGCSLCTKTIDKVTYYLLEGFR